MRSSARFGALSRRRRGALVVVAGGLALGACLHPKASTGAAHANAAPIAAGPRSAFRYAPSEPAGTRAYLALGDGSFLLVGDLGERWQSAIVPEPDASGAERAVAIEPALHRAPEALVAALALAPDRFAFAGESGAVYRASAPLAALVLAARAPEPLAHLVATAKAFVALDGLGRPWRYEDASGWDRVQLDAELVALAAQDDGSLLAIGVPEALYASRDDGRTFARVPAPLVGAAAVAALADGAFRVDGMTEALRYDLSQGSFALAGAAGEPYAAAHLPEEGISFYAPLAPSVLAIDEGRAVLDEAGYAEVLSDGAGGFWIARGALGAPLSPAPLGALRGCAPGWDARLAVRGARVVVGCPVRHPDAALLAFALFRSDDGGTTFRPGLELTVRDPFAVRLALAADGSALVRGVCPGRVASCEPSAPLWISPSDEVGVASGVALTEPPSALAFAEEGARAYLVARASDESAEAKLFASNDAGRSFAPVALPAPPAGPADGADPGLAGWSELELCPGPDGTLGMVLRGPMLAFARLNPAGEGALVALPAEQSGAPHAPATAHPVAIGCHGAALLVLGSDDEAGATPLRFAQSLDGGATMTRVPSPLALDAAEFGDAGPAMRCGPSGCVLGGAVTRSGWTPSEEVAALELAAPTTSGTTRGAEGRALTCAFDATSAWVAADGVWSEGGGLVPAPRQTLRGESAWSVARADARTGEVLVLSMSRDGRLATERLFAGGKDARAFGYDLWPNPDGYVASRIALAARDPVNAGPTGSAGPQRIPSGALELAWLDVRTLRRGRARGTDAALVPSAEAVRDSAPGDDALPLAGLSFATLAPDGVFVAARSGARAWFFDDAGAGHALFTAEWPEVGSPPSLGFVALGASPIALSSYGDSAIVGASTGTGALHWERVAGEGSAAAPEVPWRIFGARAGIVVPAADATRGAYAAFRPFTPDATLGPPEPLPAAADLTANTPLCAPAERAGSPRTVLDPDALPRSVHVTDPNGEPLSLERVATVVYGTRAAPCLDGFAGTSDDVEGVPALAFVATADLAHAWLLRAGTRGRSIEYRAARCSFR